MHKKYIINKSIYMILLSPLFLSIMESPSYAQYDWFDNQENNCIQNVQGSLGLKTTPNTKQDPSGRGLMGLDKSKAGNIGKCCLFNSEKEFIKGKGKLVHNGPIECRDFMDSVPEAKYFGIHWCAGDVKNCHLEWKYGFKP